MLRNDTIDFNSTWQKLEDAFTLIAKKEIRELSYQELYQYAYKLILNKFGDSVYENIHKSMRRIFQQFIDRLVVVENDVLINELINTWADVQFVVKIISSIFLYMNKNYIIQKKLKAVKTLSIEIYQRMLFEDNSSLGDKIIRTLLDQFKKDRDNFYIDRMKLRNCISFLIEVSVIQIPQQSQSYSQQIEYQFATSDKFYKEHFEKLMLKETIRYYKNESQNQIHGVGVAEFIEKADKRLKQEIDRIKILEFPISSQEKIIDNFLQSYIVQHSSYCTQDENYGLIFFLKENRYDEIKKMQSRETFQNAVKDYIIKTGQNLMNQREDDFKLLDNLLQFSEKLDYLQNNCFSQGQQQEIFAFGRIIRDAFEQVINQDNHIIFILNKFFDNSLRKTLTSYSNMEAENKLNRYFQIFKLIKQKDIFENQYKKLLCRRLIDGASLSSDLEKFLVTKMKQECGCSYTCKLETMFRDLELSTYESIDFSKKIRSIAQVTNRHFQETIDLEFQILTFGHWPLHDPFQFLLPEDINFWKVQFESHYLGRNQQRKLEWFYNLGFVNLKAFYEKGKRKEFVCSSLQASILLLFNKKQSYTCLELLNQLQVSSDYFYNEIESLLLSKILMKKEYQNEEKLNPSDIILFNSNFEHKSYKIKITAKKMLTAREIKQSEVKEEQIDKEISFDRKVVVESLIVRIMKVRKIYDHKNLVKELNELCRVQNFAPDIELIKHCIQNLIWREYLERVENECDHYVYKA